jgi:hypothetical protein
VKLQILKYLTLARAGDVYEMTLGAVSHDLELMAVRTKKKAEPRERSGFSELVSDC